MLICQSGVWRKADIAFTGGEGDTLKLIGANGTPIYLENINGTFRIVNAAWTAELFSIDQSGNVRGAASISAPNSVVAGCMGYAGWGAAHCWNGAGTWASGTGMSCPGGSWRAGALCTDGNCEGGFLCIAY